MVCYQSQALNLLFRCVFLHATWVGLCLGVLNPVFQLWRVGGWPLSLYLTSRYEFVLWAAEYPNHNINLSTCVHASLHPTCLSVLKLKQHCKILHTPSQWQLGHAHWPHMWRRWRWKSFWGRVLVKTSAVWSLLVPTGKILINPFCTY